MQCPRESGGYAARDGPSLVVLPSSCLETGLDESSSGETCNDPLASAVPAVDGLVGEGSR